MRFNLSSLRRGFSAVETVVAVVVSGLVVTGSVYYVSGAMKARSDLQLSSARQTYASFQQDVALRGVDPTAILPVAVVKNTSYAQIDQAGEGGSRQADQVTTVTTSAHKSALVASIGKSQVRVVATTTQNMETRATGYGLQLAADGVGITASSTPLVPPAWPASLMTLTASSFPNLNVDLIYPSNPAGTVYRYTTDGSDPTASSAIWTATVYATSADLPATLKVRAFNSDPSYQASTVVSITPSVGLAAALRREDGSSSTSFSYGDLTGIDPLTGGAVARNQVVLAEMSGASSSDFALRFTTDGSVPTMSSSAFASGGVLLLDVNDAAWGLGGITLRVVAFSLTSKFRDSTVMSYSLTPQKLSLAAPTVVAPGGTLNAGDLINVSTSSTQATLESRLTYGSVPQPVNTGSSISVARVAPDGTVLN